MYEEPVATSADHGLTDDEFRALFPKADYTPVFDGGRGRSRALMARRSSMAL
jgi:hypothetical protein